MILLCLLLIAPALAHAGEAFDAIGVHLGSVHSSPDACRAGSGRPCNDANPGAYLRSGPWVVGGYHNSVSRPTVYAGRSWPLASLGPLSLDVAALAATGYPAAAVVPLVTPTAAWRVADRASVRLSYLPRLGRWNETHVLHLSVEIRR